MEKEVYSKIISILKSGNDVQIKMVRGEIHIIEIQRKIKYKMTL